MIFQLEEQAHRQLCSKSHYQEPGTGLSRNDVYQNFLLIAEYDN